MLNNKEFYTIAEIGQAHEGSLGILHSYIDVAAEIGVNAIKFQTHIADAESSEYEPFRVKFSYEDNSRYDYWKRMEFSYEQWVGIKKHCDEVGLDFISSPFSIKAVELLEKVGVSKFKIGSGEVTNHLMLEKLSGLNTPVIISSGMSFTEELDNSIAILKKSKSEISVLQCTSNYPTKPEDWGLGHIAFFKERYNVPVGFSDHSGDIFACLSAANYGAEIFEFHITFDKRMFGPDSKSSLDITQAKQLMKGLEAIQISNNNLFAKKIEVIDKNLKTIFEKSLAVNKDLKAGSIIRIEDLETKKPADKGISVRKYTSVLGKKLARNIKQWEFINWEDLN